MSKITFYIGEKSYTFNATIEIKLDGEDKPNNLRVETILSEEIKRYINNNNLKGKPKHISIEDECFIGECTDLSVIGKLEIRTK
jgi:hypothetical protein